MVKGITALSAVVVEQEVKLQQLKPIIPEFDLPLMIPFAVYPRRQWVPSKLKVFLQYLEKWQRGAL